MKQIYYVIQTLIHGKGSIPFKVKVWSMFIMEGKSPEPQTMNMGPLAGAIFESFPIFLTDSLSCPVQDQTRG